ncbi:MAG: ROK family protein [Clostridia bacterium]|nr:ROK family protein [Clostridia bacterium]
MYSLGIDIGGTKCAVVLGKGEIPDNISDFIIDKIKFPTNVNRGYNEITKEILSKADELLERNNVNNTELIGVGISCGGPLNSKKGVIMCPPNLPDWDNVPIVDIVSEHFGVKAILHNDANACAVAEWRFGAGRGYQNLVFLTFGTGMGAGLILDGKLYTGTNDGAGEVGHIRLSEDGPEGYGKKGSFEGFCSGGGIKKLAELTAIEYLRENKKSSLFESEADFSNLTAANIAKAMYEGDEFATAVYKKCAEYLGRGLSVIIDIINPEAIVIGSIFERNEEFFQSEIKEIIENEALTDNVKNCKILSAELGESIGDFASLGLLF